MFLIWANARLFLLVDTRTLPETQTNECLPHADRAAAMARYAVALALVGVLLVSSAAAQSTSATTYCAGTLLTTLTAVSPIVLTVESRVLQGSSKSAKMRIMSNWAFHAQVLRATVKAVLWDAVGQE